MVLLSRRWLPRTPVARRGGVVQETEACYMPIDRRDHATLDTHPLATSPMRRRDVLEAIETTCVAAGDALASRQVAVRVQTREGVLMLGLGPFGRVTKRALDLVLTTSLLLLLLPLLAVIAISIKLSSPGPVTFRQRRVGYKGETFAVYKFRTMLVDAERQLQEDARLSEIYRDNGCKVPAHMDPRITRVGRTLRSTSLDELPQLLNVMRGNMSLVGPRPVLPDEVSQYGGVLAAYTAARPGVTGMWQVSGRSNVTFPLRAHLDVENLRNWSPFKDCRTLLRTIPSVLRRTGAY